MEITASKLYGRKSAGRRNLSTVEKALNTFAQSARVWDNPDLSLGIFHYERNIFKVRDLGTLFSVEALYNYDAENVEDILYCLTHKQLQGFN